MHIYPRSLIVMIGHVELSSFYTRSLIVMIGYIDHMMKAGISSNCPRFLASGPAERSIDLSEGPEARKRGPIRRNLYFRNMIDDNDNDWLCIVIIDHIMKTRIPSDRSSLFSLWSFLEIDRYNDPLWKHVDQTALRWSSPLMTTGDRTTLR